MYRADIILIFPVDAFIPDSKNLYYVIVKKVGTV